MCLGTLSPLVILTSHLRFCNISELSRHNADVVPDPWCLLHLQYSEQALAQSAEKQLALYPGGAAKEDELALDFDNYYRTVRPYTSFLDEEQQRVLDAIDQQLSDMSRQDNSHLWTETALYNSKEWERVRNLALKALEAFGWPNEVPPSRI